MSVTLLVETGAYINEDISLVLYRSLHASRNDILHIFINTGQCILVVVTYLDLSEACVWNMCIRANL